MSPTKASLIFIFLDPHIELLAKVSLMNPDSLPDDQTFHFFLSEEMNEPNFHNFIVFISSILIHLNSKCIYNSLIMKWT